MNNRIKALIYLTILILSLVVLFKWINPISNISKSDLEEKGYKFKVLAKSDYGIVYKAVKDHGAPINTTRKIIVKKDNRYYEIKKHGEINVINDTLIFNSVKHVTKPDTLGNWILMERYVTPANNQAVRFFYDSIPDNSNIDKLTDLKEGIYRFENSELKFIGRLTDFNSMHDIENSGYYYLTSPGIFYNWRMNIIDLK
jgi:hypothetical protein